MKRKIDLSIIILSYNTKDLLRDCLGSVLGAAEFSKDYKIEIIVVDNASEDGSPQMVIKDFSRVKLIKNSQNLGFAKGNNIGIKTTRGRYVLLLNSDTKVFPKTFSLMLDYMEKNPRVGVATCRVELPDGNLDPACHRGFPTPWNALTYFFGLEKLFPRSKLLSGYHLGWMNLEKTHEIDTPTGAFYLVRKEILDKVGLLDERYFMYAEDIDLSFRIKKAGWKIIFVPQTKIIHYKKKSGRKKEEEKTADETRRIRTKTIGYFFETMKIFYDKHYKDKYPFLVRFSVLSGIWCLTRLKLIRNNLR